MTPRSRKEEVNKTEFEAREGRPMGGVRLGEGAVVVRMADLMKHSFKVLGTFPGLSFKTTSPTKFSTFSIPNHSKFLAIIPNTNFPAFALTDNVENNEEPDALPAEDTEGIYDPPSGQDHRTWRSHVSKAFSLKAQSRAKQRLLQLVSILY